VHAKFLSELLNATLDYALDVELAPRTKRVCMFIRIALYRARGAQQQLTATQAIDDGVG
jgi:hypothetical protein